MFRKAETVGRLLDLKILININRDENSKLLILSKVRLRNDCIAVYKDAFTGVLETDNISKSVQGKTILY